MKISISLPNDDVSFLDREALSGVYESRSAAVQAGIRLLRERQLVDAYSEAFADWDESEDAALWESAAADGLQGNAS